MKAYLDLVKKILAEGKVKHNRTGTDALTIAHYHLEHHMSEGFPLLTTKKMATKAIRVELEGFLRGITSKKWYQERGCKIWNEWANPQAVETVLKNDPEYEGRRDDQEAKKEIQMKLDDLGPIYGYQWRSFNQQYGPVESFLSNDVYIDIPNGVEKGVDQLRSVLVNLKNKPEDRRMVCSAWNPNQIGMMALPPCHYSWHVTVVEDELHLCWNQRSVDSALGLPFNIASYATLLCLLAKHSGLKPGKVSGFLSDVHIYVDHIEQVKEQVSRTPRKLPQMEILIDQPFDLEGSELVKWTYKDTIINGYDPHPEIYFPIAV